MSVALFFSGDTGPYIVSLKLGGVAYAIAGGDTVSAHFVDDANKISPTAITAAEAQASGTAGADWANGIVAVQFSSTESNKLHPFAGRRLPLRVVVTKSAKTRTFEAIFEIRRGGLA